ncbi:hypothetical protein ACVWXU_001997 [Streptomyces sp. TE33382]
MGRLRVAVSMPGLDSPVVLRLIRDDVLACAYMG